MVADSGLDCSDEDAICQLLIKKLADEIKPRVIIENFPQSIN